MRKRKHKGPEETRVFIENEQEIITVSDGMLELIEKTIKTCLANENIKVGCEANILLTDDGVIKSINNQFRNIDKSTDVLSFPMADMKEGKLLSETGDYDPDEELLLLGDIVISMETASRQAEEYGHSFERELAFLTAHGVFHLLGYDHMEKDEETVMLSKQEAILGRLGLTRE
ncbi:MAG TPA: rRNA maturation RNase YbeY [Clostridia bacterium]|nr:rRNA maturation RNase YbeY [Clostridia bacterium]